MIFSPIFNRPWPAESLLIRVRRSLVILAVVLLAALPVAPAFAKYASLVIDADTGEIFHASHIDDRNHPASLTKIMTLYLLFDDLDAGKVHLGDTIPVSAHAAAQEPSKLGLSPGDTLTVEDAMLGIVTKSANDAAVAVAEFLAGGSEQAFTARMNRKARELGMAASEFHNANGLPNPRQFSSARDMATLARAMIHNHAKYYHVFATREFTYAGQVMPNHNHLMESYDGMDGIKTGYVAASGFNLVASVKRDGRRLIGVVFGGESASKRDRHMANLLDAAFAQLPGSTPRQQLAANDDHPVHEDDDAAKPGSDVETVMKAMANGRQNGKEASAGKIRRVAHKVEPQAAGDADDEDWGVQLGTYTHRETAYSIAQATYAKLGQTASDGDPKAVPDKHHHQWHARIVGLSARQAQLSCHRLSISLHKPCRVVEEASN